MSSEMLGALPKLEMIGGNVHYGRKQALFDVSARLADRSVSALIGPSGCGKTTFLNCLNRMIEAIQGARFEGAVLIDGAPIYDPAEDVVTVRRRFGVVAQKPNPFPDSVRRNVLYGAEIHGVVASRAEEEALLEATLRRADLWDEVKDHLDGSGLALSGGQQQRLCIARAIATRPEVLLLDEPTSAIDPIATARIEALLDELKRDFCIVIITHNMAQARRVADHVYFFHLGRIVEDGPTERIFVEPRETITQDFINGRFG